MRSCLSPLAWAYLPALAWAAFLDVPQPYSTHSGVGVAAGWICEADTITISFDGGAPIRAVYGSPRGDTIEYCGDDDNGYVLLWDWDILGSGEHLIEVFVDGVLFASATFTVVAHEEVPVGGLGELEQRIYDLEAEVRELSSQLNGLEDDFVDHRHSYLTGRGEGHNNTEVSTGPAEF